MVATQYNEPAPGHDGLADDVEQYGDEEGPPHRVRKSIPKYADIKPTKKPPHHYRSPCDARDSECDTESALHNSPAIAHSAVQGDAPGSMVSDERRGKRRAVTLVGHKARSPS